MVRIIIPIKSGTYLLLLWRSPFPVRSIVVGIQITVDLVTNRRVQSPVIGHRGAGRARGFLTPLKDPGGPAGPLY